MNASKVLPCVCKHEFQDVRYGHGKRLMNPVKKKENHPQEYRCTVCGRVSEKGS